MKVKNIIKLVLAGVLIFSLIYVYRSVFPGKRNIGTEKAEFKISASDLRDSMAIAEIALKYSDKVIVVQGTVSAINGTSINLDQAVEAILIADPSNMVKEGDQIMIKGRCVGFDDLLGEVKLDQASLIQ